MWTWNSGTPAERSQAQDLHFDTFDARLVQVHSRVKAGPESLASVMSAQHSWRQKRTQKVGTVDLSQTLVPSHLN